MHPEWKPAANQALGKLCYQQATSFTVAGGFTLANLMSVLTIFYQHMPCEGSIVFSIFYTNMHEAYKAIMCIHIVSSNHMTVMLFPS